MCAMWAGENNRHIYSCHSVIVGGLVPNIAQTWPQNGHNNSTVTSIHIKAMHDYSVKILAVPGI